MEIFLEYRKMHKFRKVRGHVVDIKRRMREKRHGLG